MAEYYTYKNQVPVKAGEKLGFTPGRGYYVIPAPTPAKAASTEEIGGLSITQAEQVASDYGLTTPTSKSPDQSSQGPTRTTSPSSPAQPPAKHATQPSKAPTKAANTPAAAQAAAKSTATDTYRPTVFRTSAKAKPNTALIEAAHRQGGTVAHPSGVSSSTKPITREAKRHDAQPAKPAPAHPDNGRILATPALAEIQHMGSGTGRHLASADQGIVKITGHAATRRRTAPPRGGEIPPVVHGDASSPHASIYHPGTKAWTIRSSPTMPGRLASPTATGIAKVGHTTLADIKQLAGSLDPSTILRELLGVARKKTGVSRDEAAARAVGQVLAVAGGGKAAKPARSALAQEAHTYVQDQLGEKLRDITRDTVKSAAAAALEDQLGLSGSDAAAVADTLAETVRGTIAVLQILTTLLAVARAKQFLHIWDSYQHPTTAGKTFLTSTFAGITPQAAALPGLTTPAHTTRPLPTPTTPERRSILTPQIVVGAGVGIAPQQASSRLVVSPSRADRVSIAPQVAGLFEPVLRIDFYWNTPK